MSVAIWSNLWVSITSPANWEQLVYNSATGLWENGTPAGWWDMLASVYDTGTTWVVDTAKDVSDSPLTTTTSVSSQIISISLVPVITSHSFPSGIDTG